MFFFSKVLCCCFLRFLIVFPECFEITLLHSRVMYQFASLRHPGVFCIDFFIMAIQWSHTVIESGWTVFSFAFQRSDVLVDFTAMNYKGFWTVLDVDFLGKSCKWFCRVVVVHMRLLDSC